MKYLSLVFVFVSLVACSEDPSVDDGSGYSSGSASSAGSSTTSVPGDTYEVAQIRAKLISDLRAKRDEMIRQSEGDFEAQAQLEKQFNSVISKLETTPAANRDELAKLVVDAAVDSAEAPLQEAITKIEQQTPARINPEPMPGEKRDAVDDNGQCSNDLQVDIGQFAIEAIKKTSALMANLKTAGAYNTSSEVRPLAQSLIDHCDAIADRYGRDAVCTMPNSGEQLSMDDFASKCEKLRQDFAGLL